MKCRRQPIASLWDGTHVMRVSGPCVRREYNPDFTEGCHHRVARCSFIPHNEIWLEAMRNREDERSVLFHELFEWHAMKYGKLPYGKAHDRATSVERVLRKHRGKLPCRP